MESEKFVGDREQKLSYLKELEQEIARFDAIKNKRDSDVESLKALHERYEEVQSQLEEHSEVDKAA